MKKRLLINRFPLKGIYLIINHTFDFTEDEIIGIKSQMKALAFYDICLVTSSKNTIESFHQQFSNYYCGTHKIQIEYFDAAFFESIQGYNKLLCSIEFYERFTNYDYIIVSQPDVFLTNPKKFSLLNKVMLKYDYVGAPWFQNIYEVPSLKKLKLQTCLPIFYYQLKYRILKAFFNNKLIQSPLQIDVWYRCGNGGFSVRKVKTAIALLKSLTEKDQKKVQEIYAAANTQHESNIFSEDIFWSLISLKLNKSIKIAPASIGVTIAWENGIEKELLFYTRNNLPIAIHAWMKLGLKSLVTNTFLKDENTV